MKILKLEAWNFSSPPLWGFNILGAPPPYTGWFWSIQIFGAPSPRPTIFSESPFRVSKNFRSPPPSISSIPPCHIKWTFPKISRLLAYQNVYSLYSIHYVSSSRFRFCASTYSWNYGFQRLLSYRFFSKFIYLLLYFVIKTYLFIQLYTTIPFFCINVVLRKKYKRWDTRRSSKWSTVYACCYKMQLQLLTFNL